MRLVVSLPCLVFALVLSGCARSGELASPAGQLSSSAVVSETVELRVGETRVFAGDLTVAFERVLEESRCPMDALCVRMGEAVVQLGLAVSSGETARREVETGGPDATSRVVFDRYSLELTALTPYPRSDRVIDLTAYTATLDIRSR